MVRYKHSPSMERGKLYSDSAALRFGRFRTAWTEHPSEKSRPEGSANGCEGKIVSSGFGPNFRKFGF